QAPRARPHWIIARAPRFPNIARRSSQDRIPEPRRSTLPRSRRLRASLRGWRAYRALGPNSHDASLLRTEEMDVMLAGMRPQAAEAAWPQLGIRRYVPPP